MSKYITLVAYFINRDQPVEEFVLPHPNGGPYGAQFVSLGVFIAQSKFMDNVTESQLAAVLFNICAQLPPDYVQRLSPEGEPGEWEYGEHPVRLPAHVVGATHIVVVPA